MQTVLAMYGLSAVLGGLTIGWGTALLVPISNTYAHAPDLVPWSSWPGVGVFVFDGDAQGAHPSAEG